MTSLSKVVNSEAFRLLYKFSTIQLLVQANKNITTVVVNFHGRQILGLVPKVVAASEEYEYSLILAKDPRGNDNVGWGVFARHIEK